jgi:hypothetical protein
LKPGLHPPHLLYVQLASIQSVKATIDRTDEDARIDVLRDSSALDNIVGPDPRKRIGTVHTEEHPAIRAQSLDDAVADHPSKRRAARRRVLRLPPDPWQS